MATPEVVTIDYDYIVGEVVKKVDVKINALKAEIADSFQSMVNTSQSWFEGITGEIRDWLQAPLSNIESAINLVYDTLTKFKENLVSSINTVMSKVQGWFDTTMDKMKGVFDDVYGRMETIFLTIQDVVLTMKANIANAFKTAIETVSGWLAELWDRLKDGMTYIGDQIVKATKEIFNQITAILANVSSYIQDTYKNIAGEIKDVYDRSVVRFKGFLDTAKQVFGDFIDKLLLFLQTVWDRITAGFDELKDMPEDLIAAAMYKMIKVQKQVLDRIHAEHGAF